MAGAQERTAETLGKSIACLEVRANSAPLKANGYFQPRPPRPPDPGDKSAARGLVTRDGGEMGMAGEPSDDRIYRSQAPAATEICSPGLRKWAERRAARLADEYLREDIEHVDAGAFLEQAFASEPLLGRLRTVAHAAFWSRIVEAEIGR